MTSNKTDGVTIHTLSADRCDALYEFYFNGTTKADRRRFSPYPLFDSFTISCDEFKRKYLEWEYENDWIIKAAYFSNSIVGIGLLKRIKAEPTTGVLVQSSMHGRGIGTQLMLAVVRHAIEIELEVIHATIEDDNPASISLHTKIGFQRLEEFKEHRVLDGERHSTILSRRYSLNIKSWRL